jgi:SAM-dependent methyltransferase
MRLDAPENAAAFSPPVNRQAYYRQEYRRLKSGWQESLYIYRDLIDRSTHDHTSILDIGCGHGDFLAPVYARTPHTYGIDPDATALEQNKTIRHKVVGTAESLPFEDNFFDLIVLAWVLEHLEHPSKAFQEIYRALKPGGQVIFITPNSWNYNVWIIRLIPHRFHDFFTRKLYQRQEHDTYRVRYKINSIPKIDRTLLPLGFKKSQVILNGDPSYISFNKPLFKLACALESLLEKKFLRWAKVHIIGVYQK